MDEKLRNRLVSWIEESMRESGFSKMTVELETNENGEGFASDVVFAQVTDKDDKNKKAHLVVKMGKESEDFRKKLPLIMEMYKREIVVYNEIFPKFLKFETKKNIVNIFNSYPKCYKTFLTDGMEVLVLENLKKSGFVVHDRRIPMNLQHTQLVLKNYAKLHALSFALRDQNQDKFNELTADYSTHMKIFLSTTGENKFENIQETLRNEGRNDLAVKYGEEIKRINGKMVSEILDEEISDAVITHGDCHNSNFLFQYKDNDVENPISLSIIDWQASSLHSPAVDLSCFLYFTSSEETLSRLEELLQFYHNHLKFFLRELGSDVEKLFPYSTLVKHWKKYSAFAFALTTTLLRMMYFGPEEMSKFGGSKDVNDLQILMENIQLRDEDVYRARLISIIEHHLHFLST